MAVRTLLAERASSQIGLAGSMPLMNRERESRRHEKGQQTPGDTGIFGPKLYQICQILTSQKHGAKTRKSETMIEPYEQKRGARSLLCNFHSIIS